MILNRLQIQNFRQFRDETLAFGDSGSVTVVHGANGAGKSTLLNAFTWLLYDEVSFDTRPERLASEGAMADADPNDQIEVTVELTLSHGGKKYQTRRYRVYEKRTTGDFDGDIIEEGVEVAKEGNTVGNPEETLDRVLPERLSELFFFDGEDIDELAAMANQEEIQEAIQNLMGLTILERAIRHLDAVAGRFGDEVDEYASEELSDVRQRTADVKEEIENLEETITDTESSKASVDAEIDTIDQKMDAFDDADRLTTQRNSFEDDLSNINDNFDSKMDDLQDVINDRAVPSLAVPLVREAAEELDQMREEGVIPSGLNSEYVEALLEEGRCICGKSISPGSEHYRELQKLVGETIEDDVEAEADKIISHLQQFSNADTEFEEKVSELLGEREEVKRRREGKQQKLSAVRRELDQMDEQVSGSLSLTELKTNYKQKVSEKQNLDEEIGRLKQQLESKKSERSELQAEYESLTDEKEEALLAKRRRRAALDVKEKLQLTFERLQGKVREMCNQHISETFEKVASKNLMAEVDDEFKLRIKQQVGDQQVEVDKSTGERQIASLAFVGSLVEIARERYESDSQSEYFSGGIYPLVMDSPFGALDKSHRRQVSRVIPDMGNQVIVFATDSQWDGPVKDEMEDTIEEEYWLDFDPGESAGSYPKTRVLSEQAATRGD